jgi:hypothetical protein
VWGRGSPHQPGSGAPPHTARAREAASSRRKPESSPRRELAHEGPSLDVRPEPAIRTVVCGTRSGSSRDRG